MIHSHSMLVFSGLIWLLTALMVSAAWLYFRRSGRTLAEAGSGALVMTQFAICLGIQAATITGNTWPVVLMPVAAAGVSAVLVWRFWSWVIPAWHGISAFVRMYPLPMAAAVAAVSFRGFDAPAGLSVSALTQIIGPVPGLTLSVMESYRIFWIQTGTALAGTLAYGAISLSTFALARRHAWPPAALTATLVVLGMPRLACPHGTTAELMIAASALFVLMTLYRIIEDPRIDDLFMLILGVPFTWSSHPMGWILPVLLTFLSVLLIGRRHGWHHLAHLDPHHRWRAIISVMMAVTITPLWSRSIVFFGQGSHSALRYNTEGLSGAAANLLRYVIHIGHLSPSARSWVRPVSLWWQGVLEGIYQNAAPLLGGNSAAVSQFNLSTGAGFGPLSLLLVLPAVGYSLIRGPRRLRAIAISIGWYWFLLALIPAWQPDNIQLLTPLMVISGFMVAFFLPPWRFSRTGQLLLNLLCLFSICYSLIL